MVTLALCDTGFVFKRKTSRPIKEYCRKQKSKDCSHGSARHSGCPRYRKDHKPYLVYEDNGFYLAVKSNTGKVKEMSGGDGPRPDEVRALLAEMNQLWKKLIEVQPAYAYLTRRPIEKDRLRLLKSKYKVDLLPIESLPASLQALLIPVVTQPRNFYPLTQAQYDQYQRYHLPLTYKGAGYEPEVILAATEIELKK